MLWWFAQTTLIAAALAALATLAGRWKRLGPEARHALWLVVLFKFAIPPVVAWPWALPGAWPDPPAAVATVAVSVVGSPSAPASGQLADDRRAVDALLPEEEEPVGSPQGPPAGPATGPLVADLPADRDSVGPTAWQGSRPATISDFRVAQFRSEAEPRGWDARSALLGLWLAGSAVVLARRGVKILRLHRVMATAGEAPAWLVEEARAIGERVGVECPPILATSGSGTPWLWCLARPRLIVPGALIGRLEAGRWPGILAHELAHLARFDHWVVRLELLLEAVWWWNPLFWLARRRLHIEAELACDARVVRALPDGRFAYAEALVDVCEHLARSAVPSPALGVGGAGASRSLEERLLMILRDPIPRRPSRRAALAITLLAALAMPAWTLGQQPEKPPAQPETPTAKPEAPPAKPEAPPAQPEAPPAQPEAVQSPAPPSTTAAEFTIEAIRAAQQKRREALVSLSFRYIVAGRNQFGRDPNMPVQAMGGGMPGGMRGPSMPTIPRRWTVRVEVADVVLDLRNKGLRIDAIEARPIPAGRFGPGKPPRPTSLPWDRQFFARDALRTMSLEIAWDKQGPVPFQSSKTPSPSWGDSLAQTIVNGRSSPIPRRPIEPDPSTVLDLNGATVQFLDPNWVHAEVAGVDVIDGHEVVRVAWIANQEGLLGLCWLAPKLGFAVIRSDATKAPSKPQVAGNSRHTGRQTWRKHASEFVLVGDAWLPGKVTTEEFEADSSATGPGGEPLSRRERVVTFEDYRIGPATPADAFRPKLAIQALDDLSGEFTANPPELPAGLVDRLKLAVKESPFGPPVDEKTTAVPEPRPQFPAKVVAASPGPRIEQPRQAVARPPANDAAKLDPGIIARPAPDFADPIPVVEPKKDDPIGARPPAGQDLANQEIARRLRSDAEAQILVAQIQAARDKFTEIGRIARPNDPGALAAKRKLDSLEAKYKQFREAKSRVFSEQAIDQARDEVDLLQIRRARKAAELRKVEARRQMASAVVARVEQLRKQHLVSQEETTKAEGDLKVAEAEVEAAKSDLDEADLLLNQARRRLGPVEAPDAGPSAATPSTSTLPELRDAVELIEVQIPRKRAELRGAESRFRSANTIFESRKQLALDKRISQNSLLESESSLQAVQDEVDQKQADIVELEVRLKQARRRAEAEEGRLKRAIERARTQLDWSEKMFKKGYVSQGQLNETRGHYDELMIQLDPKHVPGPTSAVAPSPPGLLPGSPKAPDKPGLSIKLHAPGIRLGGQSINYKIAVSNPETATLQRVRVVATLPQSGGKLVEVPDGAKFDNSSRTLRWTVDQLEPGETAFLYFAYATSTPGPYLATAEATSSGLTATDTMETDVSSVALLDLQVTQTTRLIDVGQTTHYDITIKNSGTEDATKLRVGGKLTPNLKILRTFGADHGKFVFKEHGDEKGDFLFPEIDRLAVGQTLRLTLEAQATEAGAARCNVSLSHAEMGSQVVPIVDVISTTVVGKGGEPGPSRR